MNRCTARRWGRVRWVLVGWALGLASRDVRAELPPEPPPDDVFVGLDPNHPIGAYRSEGGVDAEPWAPATVRAPGR